jgi:hypothetical protein
MRSLLTFDLFGYGCFVSFSNRYTFEERTQVPNEQETGCVLPGLDVTVQEKILLSLLGIEPWHLGYQTHIPDKIAEQEINMYSVSQHSFILQVKPTVSASDGEDYEANHNSVSR